jgi:hypothetical protein
MHVANNEFSPRTYLVMLANMSRSSCSVDITYDCSNDALQIQPLRSE